MILNYFQNFKMSYSALFLKVEHGECVLKLGPDGYGFFGANVDSDIKS